MTTICYDHKTKTIAWDSRRTMDDIIADDSAQKMFERDGVKFWICGCVADETRLIDYYFGCPKHEFKPDANAFVLDNGELFSIGVTDEHECWKEPIDSNYSIGSGMPWAIAALDFGCSAKEAVKYAKTRDCKTGGKVHIYKIGD